MGADALGITAMEDALRRRLRFKRVELAYEFDTAFQLISDFYAEVDRVLKEFSL